MSSTTASPALVGKETPSDVAGVTWAVLSAVFKIGSLVLVGAKLEHQGILNNPKRKALSALAMDVCLPCLLFADVLPEADMKLLDHDSDLPLGASLRSLCSVLGDARPFGLDAHAAHAAPGPPCRCDSGPIQEGKVLGDIGEAVTEFGLTMRQCKTVQPEWSRIDSGRLVYTRDILDLDHNNVGAQLHEPLLGENLAEKPRRTSLLHLAMELGRRLRASSSSLFDTFRELFPPQVAAVIIALALGVAPTWVKQALYDPALAGQGSQPWLGWVYGTAAELGSGFVPLQMISLGGRMLNVVGPFGPLAASGEAGPRGRGRLLRIAASVGIARMLLAPAVLYGLAIFLNGLRLDGARPMAFWAPAFIVAAMPTANNMSTMADLIGSGRSITAASTAMQLLASPVILTATLTALLAGVKSHLAVDLGDD